MTYLFCEKLEATLAGLQRRVPDLPMTSILLSRMILHLGRGMGALLEQQIRPYGLAEAEFRVLMTLHSQPDGVAHPSDLCADTQQSPANMSRIADALVERNLITRMFSRNDRRKVVLRVTAQGESLVQTLLPQLFGPLRETFGNMSLEEQEIMIALLKRLGMNLERTMASASNLCSMSR